MLITQKIIDDCQLNIPIDLNKIIDFFKDLKIEFGCDIDYDGVVERDDNGYVIKIKDNKVDRDNVKEYKERFLIAHELGHIFLGHIQNHEKMYRANVGQLNYEANEFAANLLMPKSEFIDAVYDNLDSDGYCDLVSLSKIFGVSLSAVKARGKFLGIFPW